MFANEQDHEPALEGLTIAEHARRAAEAIRAINRLSSLPERQCSLTYPQDVWNVVVELHALTQLLGPTFDQLDAALVAAAESGRVRGLDQELGDRPLQALDCGRRAATLASSLRRARDYTGALTYDVAPDWSA